LQGRLAPWKLLPDLASPWLDAFRAAPGHFAIGAIVVGVLLSLGGRLEGRVTDEMRRAWHPVPADGPLPDPRDGGLYRLRTSKYYRGFFYALTHRIPLGLRACSLLAAVAIGGLVAGDEVLIPDVSNSSWATSKVSLEYDDASTQASFVDEPAPAPAPDRATRCR